MLILKWNYIDGLWVETKEEILFDENENRPNPHIWKPKIYTVRINKLLKDVLKGSFDEMFYENIIEANKNIMQLEAESEKVKIKVHFTRERFENEFEYFSTELNVSKTSLVNTILEIVSNKLK